MLVPAVSYDSADGLLHAHRNEAAAAGALRRSVHRPRIARPQPQRQSRLRQSQLSRPRHQS